MYIASLHTLVGWKPGRWKDLKLGPKTLIRGWNGEGKSRTSTSLSLLLTGKSPGEVFAKEDAVAQAADLAQLYPAGVAEVWGDTVDGIRFLPPAPKDSNLWAHPVRAVSTALRGSADKAATFFAPFLVAKDLDITEKFPDEVRVPGVKVPTNLAQLQRAIETVRETINASAREIKDAEAVISSAPTVNNAEKIAALQASVGVLERRVAEYTHIDARRSLRQGWVRERAEIEAEGHRLDTVFATLGTRQEHISRASEGLNERVARISPVQVEANQIRAWIASQEPPDASALYALAEAAAPGENCCPGCRTPLDREAWRAWVRGLQTKLAGPRADLAAREKWVADETRSCEQAFAALRNEGDMLTRDGESWKTAQARLYARRTAFAAQPEPPEPEHGATPSTTLAELQMSLRDAREMLGQAQRASGAAELGAQARAKLLVLQRQKSGADGWLDTLLQVHAWLVEAGIAAFQERVRAYMPTEMGNRFRILLARESGAPLFRIGVEEDDGSIQYLLYGAQRAIMLYAIASACLDMLEVRPPCPVLLLDEERSIDPMHLTMLMQATATSPYQVVITSTHNPSKRIDGWTIVDLSDVRDDGSVPESVVAKEAKEAKKRKGSKGAKASTADNAGISNDSSVETSLFAKNTHNGMAHHGLPNGISPVHPDDPDAMIPPVPDT